MNLIKFLESIISPIENVGFSFFASFRHHIECKVFENPVITSLIGISKSCFYDSITSKPQMVLLSSMSFQCNYQVRFIAKYCIKDYNSTVSKIELPFFIGQ